MLKIIAFVCSAAAILATGARAGQEPAEQQGDPQAPTEELEVVLEDAQIRTRVRLAFPSPKRSRSMSREVAAAADELEATLLDDLRYSRIFDVQDQEILEVLQLTGDRQQDFVLYRSLGNQVILQAEISEESGRVILESRVLDLRNFRSVCTGKRYRGTVAQVRRIAHTYADEVVYCFSGQKGVALTQIVFASNRDGFKELYMMDYDGKNERAISGHKSITIAPAWSPDGAGIAYVSYFSGHPSIYYVDLASGNKSTVLEDGFHNFSPNMSPDGRWVAFTRSLAGNSEIFTVRRNGEGLLRITNSSRIDANPAWSPSGGEIAFTSDRSGSPQIYVMERSGANVRRVTREGDNNDGAAWHPDGSRLAYAHRHETGNRFDIAIIDLITLENRILTDGPGSHEAPTFSPDGQRIAFESTRTGTSQIWVIDVDGQNLQRVTSEGQNYAPSWSSFLD